MRFTIERLRTLVLMATALLVIALVAFLVIGKWRNPFNLKELPQRLGLDIKEEANGYTFAHALGAHSQFKIHASKVVQLKQGKAMLHDVKIELYGEDGSRVDRIEGAEFEYDQKNQTASAAGLVEITLMRPGVAPAIAPKATPAQAVGDKSKSKPLATAAKAAASGQVHVKTSGLIFDQKSGMATTSQRVDFSMAQGNGSSMGATYDSQQGRLVLDQAVQLKTLRGKEMVELHAQHAEFERGSLVSNLRAATASYRGGQATAGMAKILFRPDGSAVRLDATDGFTLATATGTHLAAPTGSLDFDQHNQPRHGNLAGGISMDSSSQHATHRRQLHGTSPTVQLEFTTQGVLRRAHLERGVEMRSEELTDSAADTKPGPLRVTRTWRSPVADVEFKEAKHGHIELQTIHGSHGVTITGENQSGNQAPVPSKLAADDVTGEFGTGAELTTVTGLGHASLDETTASGNRQTTSGDRLEAHFAAGPKTATKNGSDGAAQIQSAVIDGHVVLTQLPAVSHGAQTDLSMRATAGKAIYDSTGQWLRLSISPRVENGNLQLTADKIDVSQESGDAFAHGNVKATWFEPDASSADLTKPVRSGGSKNTASDPRSVAFGGKGPAHAIATEAQLNHVSGEATFRGHARLWQQANSISGPLILLDRQKMTLQARSTNTSEQVQVVMLSAPAADPASAAVKSTRSNSGGAFGGVESRKSASPAVIRVRGGEFKYSDAEHKALMRGGSLGTVVAETGTAASVSNELELLLLPPGNHAGFDGGQAQLDRMTARGHVVVSSQGRRGIGEQLVYSSETGEYTLTGTVSTPPRMTDPVRGTVTGEALIFHSRDDSVSIEGGGRKTTTETTAPR